MSELNEKAGQMESVLAAFNHHVRHEIANIRRQRNSLASINRLPVEILQQIFLLQASEHHLSYLKTSDIHEDVFAITIRTVSVCSRWYHISVSTPRLWSYLDSRHSLDVVPILLDRSKQAPLHVSWLDQKSREHEMKFMALVGSHLHRWKSFDVASLCSASIDIIDAKGGSAPQLERFIAHYNSQIYPIPRFVLDRAPNLRDLHIAHTKCPIGAEVLSGLINLSISGHTGYKPLEMKQYETVLSALPKVETIFIKDARISQSFPSLFTVHLPNLRAITLHNVDSPIVPALLLSIFPGSLTHVKIVGTWNRRKDHYKALLGLVRSGTILDLTMRAMTWLSMTYRPHNQYSSVFSGGVEDGGAQRTLIEAISTYDSHEDMIKLLPYQQGICPLREAKLQLHHRHDDAEAIASRIHLCTHLQHLTLTPSRDQAQAQVKALLFPEMKKDSELSQLPQLKSFILKGLALHDLNILCKERYGLFREWMKSDLLKRSEKIIIHASRVDGDGDLEKELKAYLLQRNVDLVMI
ncbi:hypothetical protein FRC02_002690 [Tulasnella sp. 418]|nr:hypothetical protein FRC02_002690 [Tulasnella sp. 418]